MADDEGFRPSEFDVDASGKPIPTFEITEMGPGALATVAQRAGAHLIDLFVILVLPSYLFVALFATGEGDDRVLPAWVPLVIVGICVAYEVLMLWRIGATLGKRLLGIEVVRYLDGGRPTLTMATIRTLITAVQYTLIIPLMLISLIVYLTAAWNPQRRGIHDRASGTIVVRSR